MLAGPAGHTGRLGRRRPVQDPGGAQPGAQHHRQVRQQPGQPDHVIPGIQHHDDVRVTRMPGPGLLQPPGRLAQLRGGHRGGVIIRAEPDRVQRRGPRGGARAQRGHERVRPPRDHLPGVPAPPVHVAEHPLRAGPRLRAQPVAYVGGQPDPPVRPARQRHGADRPPQPRHIDPAGVQRVIHRAVPPAVPGHQRQPGQHPHRPVRAQHRISQLEQLITPRGQAPVQLPAEPRQHPPRVPCFQQVLAVIPDLCHTGSHGRRLHRKCVRCTRWYAVAACCHNHTTGERNPWPLTAVEVKRQVIGHGTIRSITGDRGGGDRHQEAG